MKKLKIVFDVKYQEYKIVEKNSLTDIKDEPKYREKLNVFTSLLKDFKEYEELFLKIQNEEQQKLLNTKEITHLKESITAKNTILKELKTHIKTLREKRDAELLIIKYEDDRAKINEGDECFLCGSTSHPYITNHTKIDIDTTNTQINEKESLYTSSENELKILDTKYTQTDSKLESNNLELVKLNELCESKKELFKKESIILDADTKLNLVEQISLHEKNLNEIIIRRGDKEKLLKQKELSQENYTSKQTLYLESQKEFDKIISNQNQNVKDESQRSLKLMSLQSQLTSQLKSFDIIFDELNYKSMLENLIQRNQFFIENQINLKELIQKKNTYDLINTENNTKINALSNELVNFEESRVELESSILSLKEESLEILNVADINMFELQIKNSFDKVQKIENDLGQELTTLLTKIQEYLKQEKSLAQEISKSKDILKELTITFQKDLKNNDFIDINVFENALLVKEQRDELFLKCKTIEEKYNSCQTLKIETASKLVDHKKEIASQKSLEEIIIELSEVKIKSDEIQKNIGSSEKELEINTINRKNNEEKIKELEKKKEHFKVWVKLNEMIGSADGNKFAKFAQGITLDQLINLANNHLIVLSSRYELQRSTDPKQLLEIEVCDSFQGNVIRPVSTLSGGESFIVSLSLALGLSELASQKIAIDSLFLDEGFGTLDEDSLETALNALNLLQSSGKMVGVISHVEALKERIPLQIKVIPKGDGTSYIEMD